MPSSVTASGHGFWRDAKPEAARPLASPSGGAKTPPAMHGAAPSSAVSPPPLAQPKAGFQPIPMDRQTLRDIGHLIVHERRPSLRWSRYFVAYSSLFGAVRTAVDAGRAADAVLYPEYRAQRVEQPTFIFANARSGTTLLHRLMCLDEERFVSFKLYESILPAITFHRLVNACARLDAPLGGRLRKAVDWINESQLGGWEGIHSTGLDKPEEDECLFVYTLDAPGLLLLFPYVDELPRAYWLDHADAATRHRVMDYYEDTLKRFLYQRGGGRTFLNKNVLFTGRLRSTYEQFPDGRFIYLLRHPYEAIASFLSMFYVTWGTHSPDIPKDSPEVRAFARLAVDYYRYALDFRNEVPERQFLVLQYRDLVADPRRVVERVYEHFDMDMGAAFHRRLSDATSRSRGYRSEHDYSLEEFGLTRAWIRDRLGDLFDEFGFEP